MFRAPYIVIWITGNHRHLVQQTQKTNTADGIHLFQPVKLGRYLTSTSTAVVAINKSNYQAKSAPEFPDLCCTNTHMNSPSAKATLIPNLCNVPDVSTTASMSTRPAESLSLSGRSVSPLYSSAQALRSDPTIYQYRCQQPKRLLGSPPHEWV